MKHARSYDKRLLELAADHPMTAEEIGGLVGCYGPDAVTRLRARKELSVTIVGEIPSGKGRRTKKLYKVDLASQSPQP